MAQTKKKVVRKAVRKPVVKRESIWKRGLRWAACVGNVFFKIMVLLFLYQLIQLTYGIYFLLARGFVI